MVFWTLRVAAVVLLGVCMLRASPGFAAQVDGMNPRAVVTRVVAPVMARYGIPGMAVGILLNGHVYVYDYGVASKATAAPVTPETLFEIGSISKIFTATLASYAQVRGQLSLDDPASKYLPYLRGSSFDMVSLLDLGTHTAGGLPLQVPDEVANDDDLVTYLKGWKPDYAPGTYRVYSNVGIGLLGVIAAKSMAGDFDALMEEKLFAGLGLHATYLGVPAAQMPNYAQGYTADGAPIRLTLGVLGPQAYGIRTSVGDLLRLLEANMNMLAIDPVLQRAIIDTHTGYYKVGAMTQDLIWEQYRYPVALPDLLAGNGPGILLEPNKVVALQPPSAAARDVWINKTGTTNGFGAYVAFVPAQKFGIVLLANKSYPIPARVTAAAAILAGLLKDKD